MFIFCFLYIYFFFFWGGGGGGVLKQFVVTGSQGVMSAAVGLVSKPVSHSRHWDSGPDQPVQEQEIEKPTSTPRLGCGVERSACGSWKGWAGAKMQKRKTMSKYSTGLSTLYCTYLTIHVYANKYKECEYKYKYKDKYEYKYTFNIAYFHITICFHINTNQ